MCKGPEQGLLGGSLEIELLKETQTVMQAGSTKVCYQALGLGFFVSLFLCLLCFMYECFAFMCLCPTCVPGSHGDQKKASDPLELEL